MTPERPAYEGPSVSIEHEMRTSYLDYAMSVIVSRAIPDLRDGLKPVHRRILFAMHETGNSHDKAYRKSARPVGDVMGQYHPHGDSAIYDALVRMAQDFSMSLPLLDGQGNFGSMDGDNPAAMRYTEVRMDKPAAYLLADIDKDTVDFQDKRAIKMRPRRRIPIKKSEHSLGKTNTLITIIPRVVPKSCHWPLSRFTRSNTFLGRPVFSTPTVMN